MLIVLRGLHDDYPIVVAGNRDERTDRAASPPGLWVGERHRMLSPRDRRAGGTWMAVDQHLRFAGLTNVAGEPPVPEAPSRGHLPHLALDEPDLDAAVLAVSRRIADQPHSAFQLVLCDGVRTVVLRHARGHLDLVEWTAPALVVTNEHPPGALSLRGLPAAVAPALEVEQRLDALATLLRDPGGEGHHMVLKRGQGYGTVSSSLLAIPARDPTRLVWRFAPGPPDVTPYRNYGNLGRRLVPGSAD
jgi:hypothetical protein